MKTSLFVILLLAVFLAACSEVKVSETVTATSTPVEIPEAVIQQIQTVCEESAKGVFGQEENIDRVGKIGLCVSMIKARTSADGWQGPVSAGLSEDDKARIMADTIIDNWSSENKDKHTDYYVRVVMYQLCLARITLENSGYLTPVPNAEACKEP